MSGVLSRKASQANCTLNSNHCKSTGAAAGAAAGTVACAANSGVTDGNGPRPAKPVKVPLLAVVLVAVVVLAILVVVVIVKSDEPGVVDMFSKNETFWFTSEFLLVEVVPRA